MSQVRKKRAVGDNKMKVFCEEQFRVDGGTVYQNAKMLDARVVVLCSRVGLDFYQGCAEPGIEPWAIIEVTVAYVTSGPYQKPMLWKILIATSTGESFFPVKFILYNNRRGRKLSTSDPRKHGEFDSTQPLARVAFMYGSVSFDSFGPTDMKLVKLAIAEIAR